MSPNDYLARVLAAAKATDSDDGVFTVASRVEKLSVYWNVELAMKKVEVKRDLYDMVPSNHSMFMKIPGWALFFDISEARDPINNHDLMDSWVYDRVTRTVILNLERGAHEAFMASLQQLYSGAPLYFTAFKDQERDAEKFIEDGNGFVLSSQGRRPLKSSLVRCDAQEQAVFAGYEFMSI